MADDSHQTTESHDNANEHAQSTTAAATTGGSSVLKLIGIALGLTLVAALIVGVMFWKTLNDNASRENSVVEMGYEAAADEIYAAEEPEAEESGRPESESPDEADATVEGSADDEASDGVKPEPSVSE